MRINCAFLVYREEMEVMFMVSNATVFGFDGLWHWSVTLVRLQVPPLMLAITCSWFTWWLSEQPSFGHSACYLGCHVVPCFLLYLIIQFITLFHWLSVHWKVLWKNLSFCCPVPTCDIMCTPSSVFQLHSVLHCLKFQWKFIMQQVSTQEMQKAWTHQCFEAQSCQH